jgi:ankyrin repeat protein
MISRQPLLGKAIMNEPTLTFEECSFDGWVERIVVMPPAAKNPVRAFVSACLNGRAEEVEHFVAAGLPADTCDQYKLSGLILAGRKGHVNVAKVLVARGANIEYRDVTGRTPLFHAAAFKRYEFVEYLASLGADVNPIDMHGWTPLDFAATSHFLKMTALLERLGGKRTATEA